MPNSVISDNWSLQNIAQMLSEGLDDSNAVILKIDKDIDKHFYVYYPSACIYVECLFDFITDIVLRDQIIVDEKFEHTWKGFDSSLLELYKAGIIRSFPFLNDWEKLQEPRQELVGRLCITSSLEKEHDENREGWKIHKTTPNKLLSQTLWGGAGMLARSNVYEKGYTPHPIRRRLFIDTGIFLSGNATSNLNYLIQKKRTSIASRIINNDELHSFFCNLPPIPMQVIRESNCHNDLISVAMQMRNDFSELRGWLKVYQQAMTDGTYKQILKFNKILDSISIYIDSIIGNTSSNSTTYTAGIGIFKIAIKGQPVNNIKNQFGVRSMINKLILSESGFSEFKKFLGFFGHRNSATGMKLIKHFSGK